MNLTEELFKNSHKLDKIAFFHRDETISYPDLYAKICAVIEELKEQGCKKGDKIAIFANNSIFTVIAYFGIIGNGNVAVPLYPRVSEDSYLLHDQIVGLKSRAILPTRFVLRQLL